MGLADRVLRLGVAAEGALRPGVRGAAHPERAQTVLVLEYNLPLGYCVHMTQVFEALQRGGKRVVVATRGLGLEVLRHSPFVDALIETPDPMADFAGAVRALRAELRRRGLRPDCCLTGSADQRTRWVLVGALACRGWRGGFAVHNALLHWPLRYDPGRSRAANNLRLAELVGCPAAELEPRAWCSEADAARARELLAVAGERPRLALAPCNSGGLPTAWVPERWAEVARWAEDVGFAVFWIGAARDVATVQAIRGLCGGAGASLAGRTSVSELAAVLAACDLVASITTGAMHVARGAGTPMVMLQPAWEPPLEWMPPPERPEFRGLQGSPRSDRPASYRMEEIAVEQVIAALQELAARFPPATATREARLRASVSDAELM